MQDFSKHSL